MTVLPYYEDINFIYLNYIFNTLFPRNTKNKFIVYTTAFLHLIGTMFISLGIFFPKEYHLYYFIYLVLIASSYFFFKGHCFMTLLTNKYSGRKESPLHIRMKTARFLLTINIVLAFIALINPKLSVNSFMKYLFCS